MPCAMSGHSHVFLIDEHITQDTEWIVRRIAAEGHAIALHSGSRKPVVMSSDGLAARLSKGSGSGHRTRRTRAMSSVPAPRRLAQRHDV